MEKDKLPSEIMKEELIYHLREARTILGKLGTDTNYLEIDNIWAREKKLIVKELIMNIRSRNFVNLSKDEMTRLRKRSMYNMKNLQVKK